MSSMPGFKQDWPNIEAGICRLRPARQADLPALHAAVTDPRFPPDLPLASMARENQLAGWLARLTTPDAAPRLWSVTGCDNDACIGQIGLLPIDNIDAHWVSYWLAPACWGRGMGGTALSFLADAALARPGYTRLIAAIAPDNRASIAVIHHAGFVAVSAPDIPAAGSLACDTFERRGRICGQIP